MCHLIINYKIMKTFYQLQNKSFSDLGVKTYKELWEKVSTEYRGLSACVHTEFKQAGDNENKFNVIMSTATEDRHGDIVEQNWDLKSFKKNPVFLDSHNYSSIEHIIGKVNKIKVKDGKLQGEIEFNLHNPKGVMAFNMALNGFLNATSVGFIPKDFDGEGKIVKSELLEDSAVSVPANAEALFEKATEASVEKSITECSSCGQIHEDKCEEIPIVIKITTEPTIPEESKMIRALKNIESNNLILEARKKYLIKQATNLMNEISTNKGRASSNVNKAVKRLLEYKKIN